MTAMHLSSAPRAWRDRCAQATLALIAASSLICGCEALAEETITAVYKPQEVSFRYRTADQFSSCSELQQRVALILIAVGARDDIDVKVRNCYGNRLPEEPAMETRSRSQRDQMDTYDRRPSETFREFDDGRELSATVNVRVRMPVEATPKVLEEIDKDKSRRELLARVTGNTTAFDDTATFPAQRAEVTLSKSTIRLRAEDCELLEQMSQQVFRKLGVRVIRKSTSCGRGQSSRIPPQLTAEALFPAGSLLRTPTLEKEEEPAPPIP